MAGIQPHSAQGGKGDRKPASAGAPTIDMHSHLGAFFSKEGDAATPVAAMRAGGVAGCVASAIGDLAVIQRTETGLRAFRQPEAGELFGSTSHQLDRLEDAVHHTGLVMARSAAALREAVETGQQAVIAGIEGADYLERDMSRVEWAYGRGVRLIQLVHYRVNCVGDIQTEPPRYGGLTDFGVDLVAEMDRLGMLIDVAHATLAVTDDVADQARNPILLSHTLVGDAHPRMISPDHARLVAQTGGVIGAWPSKLVVQTLEEFVDGILRLVGLVGADHVGIGTDHGAVRASVLGDYAHFDVLVRRLGERGLSPEEIGKIMGGNFVRVLERVVDGTSRTKAEPAVAG